MRLQFREEVWAGNAVGSCCHITAVRVRKPHDQMRSPKKRFDDREAVSRAEPPGGINQECSLCTHDMGIYNLELSPVIPRKSGINIIPCFTDAEKCSQ